MSKKLHPTEQDFIDNRRFCIVHVVAGIDRLSAEVTTRKLTITKHSNQEYRINPYGMLEWINLGEFQLQSSGGYSQSGVIIGYAEDEAELLIAAKRHLEKIKIQYLKGIREDLATLESVDVQVPEIA